jgi:hypothetical protein
MYRAWLWLLLQFQNMRNTETAGHGMPETLDKEKLAKILGMLASDKDGERAAAGLLASRMLKASGLTWDALLSGGARMRDGVIGRAEVERAYKQGFAAGAAKAAEEKAAAKADRRWESFKTEYPDEAEWLEENEGISEFADSLMAGFRKFGSLTERQLAAIRRNINRERENEDSWNEG